MSKCQSVFPSPHRPPRSCRRSHRKRRGRPRSKVRPSNSPPAAQLAGPPRRSCPSRYRWPANTSPAGWMVAQRHISSAGRLPVDVAVLHGHHVEELVAGLNAVEYQFVAPRTAGQVTVPSASASPPPTPAAGHRCQCRWPKSVCNERLAEQKLAIRPVQNIEEAVPIRLQQQLASPTLKRGVHQHQRLSRVPVVKVVRGELEMPAQLSGLRIERDDAIRVEIVASALARRRYRERDCR